MRSKNVSYCNKEHQLVNENKCHKKEIIDNTNRLLVILKIFNITQGQGVVHKFRHPHFRKIFVLSSLTSFMDGL